MTARIHPLVNPMVAGSYDRLAPIYDGIYRDGCDRAEDQALRRLLSRAPMSGPVLDLGCGTGALLDLLQLAPERYLGLDVSPNMIAQAREKHPDHTFTLSWDLATVSAPFGALVGLFGVWNYLPDRPAAAAQFARWLEPGGSLVLLNYTPRHRYLSPLAAQYRSQDLPHRAPVAETLRLLAPFFERLSARGFVYRRSRSRAALLGQTLLLGRVVPDLARYVLITGRRR